MVVDLMMTLAGVCGAIGYALQGNLLYAIVWAVIAAYAFGNYSERKLKGSKYDY